MAGILPREEPAAPSGRGDAGGGGGVELGWGNGTSCWVLSFRQTNLTEQGKVGLAIAVCTFT